MIIKSSNGTPRRMLEICREIEETCSEIYFFYSERFRDDPFLHQLWEKTAHDEINHANIIALAGRCGRLELRGKNHDLGRFRSSADALRRILTGLKEVGPNAEDALRGSINLEKRLAAFHLDQVVEFADQQEARFFRALLFGDRQHLARLRDAYALLQADNLRPGDC